MEGQYCVLRSTERGHGTRAIAPLKELSHGSPHTHRKIDNDIHNVLCQQLARRQNHRYYTSREV